MAERRMFTKRITESDAFLDMPASTQALYFHLCMNADDDGFVNSPKSVQRTVGASVDDLKLLLLKKFIISFESGVIVIKHWKMHNYLRTDRYKPTDYIEEKAMLSIDAKKAYTMKAPGASDMDTNGIPTVSTGKDRIELGKSKVNCFIKPSLDEVAAYCSSRNNTIDPERFYDFYESNGWKVGRNPMKDWKAAVRSWERSPQYTTGTRQSPKQQELSSTMERLRRFANDSE